MFLIRRSDSVTVTTASVPQICYGAARDIPRSASEHQVLDAAGRARALLPGRFLQATPWFFRGSGQGRCLSAVGPVCRSRACRRVSAGSHLRSGVGGSEGEAVAEACCTETAWFCGSCCGRRCRGGRRSQRWVGCCSPEPPQPPRGKEPQTRGVWSGQRGENHMRTEPGAARRPACPGPRRRCHGGGGKLALLGSPPCSRCVVWRRWQEGGLLGTQRWGRRRAWLVAGVS